MNILILILLTCLTLAGCTGESNVVTVVRSPTPKVVSTDTPIPTPIPIPTATASPTQTPTPTSTPTPEPTVHCQIDHVVMISIDGLRPDALEEADTPIFDSLRKQGAYHSAAQAVVPSVTLINHASMLGGMSPEKHGISWNVQDEELGKIKGPTLFSEAHAAGLSTAMVTGKPKLEHLVLPDSVDQYIYAGFLDRQVIDSALEVIKAGLPDILFIHLPDVDSAGHASGWMSSKQLAVITRTDLLLDEIIVALQEGNYWEQTLLIITSDHGGTGRRHGSASLEDTLIPWLAIGPGVPAQTMLQNELIIYDTAATVLHIFRLPIPEIWDGQPVLEGILDCSN